MEYEVAFKFCVVIVILQGVTTDVKVTVPEAVGADLGKSLLIPCTATHDGKSLESLSFMLQWFSRTDTPEWKRLVYVSKLTKDIGKRMDVSEDFTLHIFNMSFSDVGSYLCQLSVVDHGTIHAPSKAHIFSAPTTPEIVIESKLSASETTQKVGVCTSKDAYPKAFVKWHQNGKALPEQHVQNVWTRQKNQLWSLESVLTHQITRKDDNTRFHCQLVYNMSGANFGWPPKEHNINSTSVNIVVHYPATEAMLHVQGHALEGHVVTLECSTDGNPQPLYSEFYRILDDGSRLHLANGRERNRLLLYNASRDDSGEYACSAAGLSNLQATTDLHVHCKPKGLVMPTPQRASHSVTWDIDKPILSQREEIPAKLGTSLVVHCNAKSSTTPKYAWKKEGIGMAGQVVSLESTLHIKNASYKDSGNYTCESVLDIPELRTSTSVVIIIEGPPVVQGNRESCTVWKADLVLQCHVLGFPKPHIVWDHQGAVEEHWLKSQSLMKSNLSINSAGPLNITCNASNALGMDSRTFYLQMKCQYRLTADLVLPTKCSCQNYEVLIIAMAVAFLFILLLTILITIVIYKNKRNNMKASSTSSLRRQSGKETREEDQALNRPRVQTTST
uniref:CD166 antigen-like isoform X2 n=1 Tax=Myxine glutinosa TaxID=7769 RepID=UPI00358F7217